MKFLKVLAFTAFSILISGCSTNEWIPLFNGKDLSGWHANENQDTWKVVNGEMQTSGPRSHLFYTGDVGDHNFKNFELMLDVKTMTGANNSVYFQTEY